MKGKQNTTQINPLDLIIGLAIPVEFSIKSGENTVVFRARPMRMRTVLALWGALNFTSTKIPNICINNTELLLYILNDCIQDLVINDEKIDDFTRLHPAILSALVDFCLSINGLAEPGASLLQKELDIIKENVKMRMQKEESAPMDESNLQISPYFFLAQLAYSAFTSGARLTADYWLDEPYLLVMLAMTVARGENEYYDALMREARTQTSIPVIGTDLSSITRNLSTLPTITKQPIKPTKDKLEDMLKVLETVAGVKIHK